MKLMRTFRIGARQIPDDFALPSDVHTFGRVNVVYSWSGSGRMILLSLLALVQRKTALTECEVELESDGPTAHYEVVRS